MTLELLHALVPLLGLAVCVETQVLAVRARGGAALLRSLAQGLLAGLLAVVLIEAWFVARLPAPGADRLALAVVDVTAYAALWGCYFNFVNLGVTARRPRILIELREEPAGLTYPQLLERYNAAEMVDARLGRLLANGQVLERDGRFWIGKPVMLGLARAIVFAKRVVLGRESEFDAGVRRG